MPIYTLKNKKTGKEWDEFLSYDELLNYLNENPKVVQVFSKSASIGDPVRLGLIKPDGVFRDRLKEIKKYHRGSKINTFD